MFLAASHGLQDLNFPTRDGTWTTAQKAQTPDHLAPRGLPTATCGLTHTPGEIRAPACTVELLLELGAEARFTSWQRSKRETWI